MGRYVAEGKQILHYQDYNDFVGTHIADAGDTEKAQFLVVMANAPQGEAGGPYDYMAEADRTCSVIFAPQNIDKEAFVKTLCSIVEATDVLNLFKKLLVRGKSPADLGMSQPKLHESLAVEFDPKNTAEDEINILHGLIGVITEAGEMAELLLKRLDSSAFDKVNAMEEGGDVSWYLARMLRGCGADMHAMHKMNIDKLHGRHGETFNVERDWSRDLGAERKKLEAAAAPLFDSEPLIDTEAMAAKVAEHHRFEDAQKLGNLGAIPARVRNDPPLPVGMAPVERHDKKPAGDCEGMDC